jgi:hypothetical protein
MISLIIGSTTDPWFTYMWTRSIYLDQEGILKEKNMFTVQGIYYFMKVIPGVYQLMKVISRNVSCALNLSQWAIVV